MSTLPFDLERTLQSLTLEEKAALTSGHGTWHSEAVERLGIPAIMLTDGPHGVRKQVPGGAALALDNSVPATCFPTAATLGSTWDVELLTRVGEALGREARANEVSVLLGPGVNIKRTPLCGRNFEYFSEDPALAGELAAALITGMQSQGVGASLKHFAANNQESDRMRVSVDVDERTLREIYFPAFERAVIKAQPWTVMCSYNKINDVFSSQSHWLLTEVLRDEWGYDGLVVSDWGAAHDRAAAVAGGLDLAMPGTSPSRDDEVVAAVRDGRLPEPVLDDAVRRVLQLVLRSQEALASPGQYDAAAHHELAREAAADGAVLLKNDPVDGAPVLPIGPALAADVAVIGEFARTPRYQGAGSSQIVPTRLDDALSALRAQVGAELPFAPGFTFTGGRDGDDTALLSEAVALARTAGTVALFLGLPSEDESEGFDRPHLDLPENQVAVLEAIAAVNPRVVVVLSNGSVVRLPWADRVPAVLDAWLGGQAGGSAVADLLLGVRSPSGRLAETIPRRLEDTPAFGNFPGEYGEVRYGEGVLVGYRWYDTRQIDVAFPFGHGLSYSTFGYDGVAANVRGEGVDATVDVSVTVTNTGSVTAAEVVQVYVGDPEATVQRPTRELKAFAKVALEPGESRPLAFTLTARDLSFWHPQLRRWVVEGGRFVVSVGASSRDLRGSVEVELTGEHLRPPLTRWSTLGEWMAHPVGGPILAAALQRVTGSATLPEMDFSMAAMIAQMPMRFIVQSGFTGIRPEDLDAMVDAAES